MIFPDHPVSCDKAPPMYKIMIIDDFEADQEAIAEIIAAITDLPISIVDICDNAVQARDKIQEHEPDIIICDIQMPFVDGLLFARETVGLFPNIYFIFCTLYDKFEYVREALNLHSMGYLLKPIDPQEMKICLRRIVESLDNRIIHDHELQNLRLKVENNLDMLRNSFYHDLLLGFISDVSELREKLELLSLDINGCLTIISIIEIDDFAQIAQKAGVARPVVTMKIVGALRRRAETVPRARGIRLDDSHFAYIRSFTHEINQQNALRVMMSDCHNLIQQFRLDGIGLTAAIGNGTENLMLLSAEYEQCRHQLRFKYSMGSGRIITAAEIPYSEQPMDIDLNSIMREVRYILSSEDDLAAESLIESLFAPTRTQAHYQCLAYSLTLSMVLVLREYEIDINAAFNGIDIWEMIPQFETIKGLKEWFGDLIGAARSTLSRINAHKRLYLIERIRQFIGGEDPGSLSLQVIAAEFHYSPNHINSVFKKETGQTISDYITEQRINRAKKLLSDRNIRLYEVSTQLGYSHAAHFNNVFKKYVGITPREYRDGRNYKMVAPDL